jgi:hypothetical protein
MLRAFDIQTRKFTPFGPVPGTAIIDTGAVEGRRRILYATAKIDDDALRFERPVFQFDATGGDAPPPVGPSPPSSHPISGTTRPSTNSPAASTERKPGQKAE